MEDLPPDAIPFTIDVVGLYFSILQDKGLEALGTVPHSRDNQQPFKETLLRLAMFVLPIFLLSLMVILPTN